MELIDLDSSSLRRALLDGDSLLLVDVTELDLARLAVADVLNWRCSSFSNSDSFSKTEPVLL